MKKLGFTLIELMIVVAIVVFLSAVSIPQYVKYIGRARQAEVAMNLAALHTAQQAYYAEHGHYTNVLNGENGLDWQPAGYKSGAQKQNFYYTYGFNFPGAQEGVHYFIGKLGASREELGETHAEGEGFVAKAVGDVTGKKKLDIWQVDEARNIANTNKGF